MTLAPDILQYSDPVRYLHDAYAARRSNDRKFSQRFINQKMGTQSSGWFADVLAGRKKLKTRHVTPLAVIFKLDLRQKEFLRVLVTMEQSDSPEEKNAAYEKWFELKGVSREKVAKDRFKYFERWYYPVLRELLAVHPFRGDYAELAAKLHPPIQPKEAKEAVALLMRLGLVNPGAPSPVLVMDTAVKTPQRVRILKSYMQLAVPALEKFSRKECDFSGLTLTLSPEGLKKASEEIASLCGRLLALSERDGAGDRVYQFLFQGFPVSHPVAVTRD